LKLGIHSKAIADRRRVDEDYVIDQAGMSVKHHRARQRRAAVDDEHSPIGAAIERCGDGLGAVVERHVAAR
jgi:hypothetical protein